MILGKLAGLLYVIKIRHTFVDYEALSRFYDFALRFNRYVDSCMQLYLKMWIVISHLGVFTDGCVLVLFRPPPPTSLIFQTSPCVFYLEQNNWNKLNAV
jgi:hypothetical protein